MILTRNVEAFVVSDVASVREALAKARRNRVRTLFAVDASGRLVGALSSGDVHRWLLEQAEVDLSCPVGRACNRSVLSVPEGSAPREISARFTDRIDALPVVDGQGRLVALALRGRPRLRIGEAVVGPGEPVFVVAEIGNNHNGSVARAKELVDLAAEAGADCVKFQLRDLRSLYGSAVERDEGEDLGSQYVLDLLRRFNLEPEALFEIFDHARARGILPLCTPWDVPSFEALERYGVAAYKIASADLTHHELLARVADAGRPLLLSTGMSSEAEILDAVRLLGERGAEFALLHCNSTYPTPYKDVNLRYLTRLAEIAQVPVGYSGHERGWMVPVAAVALGACVIEKHLTLDRDLEGSDHKVSLLPDEFREMVQAIRATEAALGLGDSERVVTQGERLNRETLAKSLAAAVDLAAGEVITREKIEVVSPGRGLQPDQLRRLIGTAAPRPLARGELFYPSDLCDESFAPRDFAFDRPWGLPVRFHDFAELTADAEPDFVEFHLSYRDLDLDPADFLPARSELGFAVHAPELFAGDQVLDLASDDPAVRALGRENLARVVDLTRRLVPFFARPRRPLIVTNVGGFSADAPLDPDRRDALYARVAEELAALDTKGVEIVPQTMPPFPWHFGGQRHHNLFLAADEIRAFCQRSGARVCLDLSHTRLACNHHGWDLARFMATVGEFVAHLHVADARGVDEEGLQVGDGEIDFHHFGQLAARFCPRASFIPEVWQGHKNKGEGFWKALGRLEGLL